MKLSRYSWQTFSCAEIIILSLGIPSEPRLPQLPPNQHDNTSAMVYFNLAKLWFSWLLMMAFEIVVYFEYFLTTFGFCNFLVQSCANLDLQRSHPNVIFLYSSVYFLQKDQIPDKVAVIIGILLTSCTLLPVLFIVFNNVISILIIK